MSTANYDILLGTRLSGTTQAKLGDEDHHRDEDERKEPVTTRIELMDITEKERPYGDRPLIIPTSTFNKAKDVDTKYLEYAVLLRRRVDKEGNKVDKNGNHLETTLEIWSPIIRAALGEILLQCLYLNLAACPIEIPQPYHALFHYRKEIRAWAELPDRTQEEQKHMNVLTNFMRTNLAKVEREYEQYEPKGHVTFKLLWTLFRPETIIVFQTDHYKECYRVDTCNEITTPGGQFFEIQGWAWAFNGVKFGPTQSKLTIPEFQGARVITDMEIYPLWLLHSHERNHLEKALIDRGKKWKSLTEKSHRHYTGPVWVKPPFKSVDRVADLVMIHADGRCFFDYNSHQENNYEFPTILYGQSGPIKPEGRRGSFSTTWSDSSYDSSPPRGNILTGSQKRALNDMICYSNTEGYELSDYQALLCPARARGFVLTEKQWGFFLVDNVRDIVWSESVFQRLELEPSVKKKVRALVEIHYSNTFDDIIAGKGKGLVFLLHGPPGTGKTLTAESVAEHTRKPLYYIGAGELGMDVSQTENRLRKIFDLAKSWGAILLLDEADVFLAKRTSDDMRRNGFVTVFLRLLEYHEGILFLTTNRIEEFDPAFASRIHLKLEYDDLSPEKRANIWRNLLEQVESCRNWDQSVYKQLGKELVLNGRDIKNLIRTSVAIAKHDKEELGIDVIKGLYELNFQRGGLIGGKESGLGIFEGNASKSGKSLLG